MSAPVQAKKGGSSPTATLPPAEMVTAKGCVNLDSDSNKAITDAIMRARSEALHKLCLGKFEVPKGRELICNGNTNPEKLIIQKSKDKKEMCATATFTVTDLECVLKPVAPSNNALLEDEFDKALKEIEKEESRNNSPTATSSQTQEVTATGCADASLGKDYLARNTARKQALFGAKKLFCKEKKFEKGNVQMTKELSLNVNKAMKTVCITGKFTVTNLKCEEE